MLAVTSPQSVLKISLKVLPVSGSTLKYFYFMYDDSGDNLKKSIG